MPNYIPKESLTAYQRWELAALDENKGPRARNSTPSDADREASSNPGKIDDAALSAAAQAALRDAAAEEGRQAGYAAGHAAGYQEGMKAANREAAKIASVASEFTASVEHLEAALAADVLTLSTDIARQVIRASLRIKPELLLAAVREAMAFLANPHGHPALYLHPQDAALVRSELGEQFSHTSWRIVEDPTLERGGCRIESGGCEIDASLARRWQRVIEQIGVETRWLDD